ncbi:hypothetical protein KY311_00330 [Candidatus Woesearchaeota archaeon]|nr:hypothetical protein [Candidatus Woesearchaeota archaeon]
MAINFVKNIAQGKIDSATHYAFVRYGMGEFVKEDLIIKFGSSVKLSGGFEYVNVFVKFVASLCDEDIEIKGVIPTINDISSALAKYGIEVEGKTRYGKKGKKYDIDVTLSPEKAMQFIDEFYDMYLLLDLKSGKRSVKVKKKETPKIGSPSEKFVSAALAKEDAAKVKEEFLFDVDAGVKEAVVKHTYKITNIDVDESLLEKDALKARLEAKREGVLVRKVIADGKEIEKEYKFRV